MQRAKGYETNQDDMAAAPDRIAILLPVGVAVTMAFSTVIMERHAHVWDFNCNAVCHCSAIDPDQIQRISIRSVDQGRRGKGRDWNDRSPSSDAWTCTFIALNFDCGRS